MQALLQTAFPALTPAQREKFLIYYNMLADWNTRMNLTAITAPDEVVEKHFLDSVLPERYIPRGARVVDIGTGAGFPGVPLLIVREDIDVTLLDPLNKRLIFLNEVLKALELTQRARTVHFRAEEGARAGAALRGRFDAAATRAVASVDKLVEYTVPYLKTGGAALLYKGGGSEAELHAASRALKELRAGAKIEKLDAAWGERCVIIIKKLAPTPDKYPRSTVEIKKKPLV